MSQIGEGTSITTEKESGLASLKVSVRDIITGERIPAATINVNGSTKEGDEHGEAEFSDLPVGMVDVDVKKHFKDADYVTFLVHRIPFSRISLTRSWDAKSAAQDVAFTEADQQEKLRIEIPAFRLEDGVRLCRQDLKLWGDSGPDYGHWWIEIGDKSYGWWPEEDQLGAKELPPPTPPAALPPNPGVVARISHMAKMASYTAHQARYKANYTQAGQLGQAFMKTFAGVPGILNGNERNKKMEKDPYHGGWKQGKSDEDYHPVINDGRSKEEIYEQIREFALAYSGEWSWIFEFGNNCHTFQVKAMSQLDLKKVKKM